MKPIDLFEAMNDLPPDILLSAEAHRSDTPARPPRRRLNLAQSSWFAAGISLFVALGVVVTLVKVMNRAADNPASGLVPNGTVADALAGFTTLPDAPSTGQDRGYEVQFGFPDTAVPLAQLPNDTAHLTCGTWGVPLFMGLLSGTWMDKDGMWVGRDANINLLYFLGIETTLYLEIGTDSALRLSLPDSTVQDGSFKLYQASGDNDARLLWEGDQLSGWCQPSEDGASRTLNTGVFYLTVPLTRHGATVDGKTEVWNYEAAVRLVVTDKQPYRQETTGEAETGDETQPTVPSSDTSVAVAEIPASDVFWWEIGDGTRGIAAAKCFVSCTIYQLNGEVLCGDGNSTMEQFRSHSPQPTLPVTGDKLALKFHMPTGTGYEEVRQAVLMDESENILETYSLTDGAFLLERDDAMRQRAVFLKVSVLQYEELSTLSRDMAGLGLLNEYRFDILIRLTF